MTIIHVARNNRVDYTTRTLGEAYPVLKIANNALREFEKCLELLRASDNEEVRKSAQSFFEMLGEVRHDCSWAYIIEQAKDAAEVAMVKPINRST